MFFTKMLAFGIITYKDKRLLYFDLEKKIIEYLCFPITTIILYTGILIFMCF